MVAGYPPNLPRGSTVYWLELWYCGDECNCWQPKINRRKVTYTGSPGDQLTDTIWEGTFYANGGEPEDWTRRDVEMAAARTMLDNMQVLYGANVAIQV